LALPDLLLVEMLLDIRSPWLAYKNCWLPGGDAGWLRFLADKPP